MQKPNRTPPRLVTKALDSAFGDSRETLEPGDMIEKAVQEVQKAQAMSEPPIGMIDEVSGKYILVFPSGRKQVCRSKVHAMDVARGYRVDKLTFTPVREIYDPTTPDKPFRGGDGLVINIYEKSSYQTTPKRTVSATGWPTIQKLLENVIPDKRTREAFMNWFAVVFNTGKKTGTSWVFLGSQGSGKTLLITEVLFPLLGFSNCVQLNQDALTTRFNELMDKRQLVCFNEVHSSRQGAERIKTWITEGDIRLEDKSGRAHVESNHLNLIFTSNSQVPVQIDADDRRFSVIRTAGPLVELPWFCGGATVRGIERELESFAVYLHAYPYAEGEARRPVKTLEKERLIQACVNPFDQLVDMLRRKRVHELKKAIGVENLTDKEMSELSGFHGSMTKDLLLKVAKAVVGESVTKKTLTPELKRRGVGEIRGSAIDGERKRAYVWGEYSNPDKSDKTSN